MRHQGRKSCLRKTMLDEQHFHYDGMAYEHVPRTLTIITSKQHHDVRCFDANMTLK